MTSTYIVTFNQREWKFTDETEAWLFAHYWNLL
jgi:hypothetical protein